MNTPELLLQAIEAQPDDDLPRLAYADWLDEHGDAARAELIRAQVALARGGLSAEQAAGLRQRELALLREHRARWDEALPADLRGAYAYVRGFPVYGGQLPRPEGMGTTRWRHGGAWAAPELEDIRWV